MGNSTAPAHNGQAATAPLLTSRYLVLSALSGFVELGGVTYAVLQQWPISVVLTIGFAYQAGALVHGTGKLPRSFFIPALLTATALCLVSESPYVLAFAVLLLSAGLQGVREEALSLQHTSTLAKRLSRIVGFTTAGVFSPMTAAVVAVLAAGIGVASRATESDSPPHPWPVRKWPRAIDWVMVIHQAHYFAYAYAIPYLFLATYGLSPTSAALGFALGWVSYSIAPLVLARCPALPTLVLGHLLVAFTLLAMASVIHRPDLLLVAWFVTGFGGGTVFLIRRLEREWRPKRPAAQFDVWEHIGHVFGVLIAVTLTSRFPNVTAMLLAGSTLAAGTAILILATVRSGTGGVGLRK